MDCSLPDSSVHRILQARILEWVTISLSKGSSQPRDWTHISCIAGRFFTTEPLERPLQLPIDAPKALGKPVHVCVFVPQSCLTLCYPVDYSPPGSSVHGFLQAGILECAAISFSRGSSWPRGLTQVSYISGGFFTIWATKEAKHSRQTQKGDFILINFFLSLST